MIELKAELMKKRKELEEAKNKTGTTANKLSSQLKSKSKIVNEADQIFERKELTEEELKKSRESLEAKARLYQQLERGKLCEGDLSKTQRENLMVDFTYKGWDPEKEDFNFDFSSDEDYESDSEKDKLGFEQVLKLINEDEDSNRWIEYEDEFGRARVAQLGQLRQIERDREEVNKLRSETSHYDGDAEIRNKGVGFYRFAQNEEERRLQILELRKLREETIEKRMRTLLTKEQRRLRIEGRLSKLKERKTKQNKM